MVHRRVRASHSWPARRLYSHGGGEKMSCELPVESAQRRPILCLEFMKFWEPSVFIASTRKTTWAYATMTKLTLVDKETQSTLGH